MIVSYFNTIMLHN